MIAPDLASERERMVRDQLLGRGIRSPRVLEAFRTVPRHLFVTLEQEEAAYEDRPLPIGYGQTISQPYMVAAMTEALEPRPGDKVLEVGTGSGYQAAILAALGARVYTIERIPELSERARRRIEELGCREVHFRVGDGTLGWPEEVPFDRIIVTAGSPEAPVTLLSQLGEGGLLVIPIGDSLRQELTLFRRGEGRVERKTLFTCSFVRLVGSEGWPEAAPDID